MRKVEEAARADGADCESIFTFSEEPRRRGGLQ